MKKLHRYLFFKLLGPFFFGLVGTTLIIALDPLQKSLDFYFNNRIDFWIVLTWFLNSIPKDMLFIFPTSAMLAGLLVFAQMSRSSELVAIQAGGIGFLSCLKPVALFAFLAFGMTFYIQDFIIPPALKIRTELFRTKIRQFHEPKIRRDVVMRLSGDRLLFIGEIDLSSYELRRVLIKEYSLGFRQISASSARMTTGGGWELLGATESRTSAGVVAPVINRPLPGLVMDLDLGIRDLQNYEEKKPQEMSFQEILDLIDYHQERGVISTIPLQVDFWNKTAFPFAVMLFAFIGAGLGVGSHRGGGSLGFGISLIFSFLYFLIMALSLPLGRNQVLPPFLAGWLQNLVFLGIMTWVIYRRLRVH